MHSPVPPSYPRGVARTARLVAALSIVALGFATGVAGPGSAQPELPSPIGMPPDRPHIAGATSGPGRLVELTVHSAAMANEVTVRVLPAADRSVPAPTLYLLNGIDGGADGNWLGRTDVVEFFRDKQVNVVIPFGGASSYFTDWRADDPMLGRQRWATFLTRELPPIVDAAFGGNGSNAIAGISMAGTSVFQLALAAPGLYRAIGSYSGCVRTSDPQGQVIVSVVVSGRRGNVVNMWGPPTDPAWAANDPYLHADELRGTAIYVASGTGAPGPYDTLDSAGIEHNPGKLIDQLLIGGALETFAERCTRQLRERLDQLAIPATFELRGNGTHSWSYWQEDLHSSWPVFAAALGTS